MITVENLKFGYRKRPLFGGLNLQLKAGSIYGLLGKNGAGKSTLLKLMTGLLSPETGGISIKEFVPFRRETAFLQSIFFLPEEFDMPRMTGMKFAETYGLFYPNFSMSSFQSYCKELDVKLFAKMTNLSFGQKKKVLIAFALACNTQIVIMDEPTNGLDIPSKSSFRRILSSISTEDKLIIVSTHQVRDLNQLIDAMIILDDGEIVVSSTVNEISDKFAFKVMSANDDALYSEQTVQGRWGLTQNVRKEETPFDMELFFNAVIAEKEKIKKIIDHE